MPATDVGSPGALAPYLPLLVRSWLAVPGSPRARSLDASLVSVDISGFTALAERLQSRGKAGAEELVAQINRVFAGLIPVAAGLGGDVLKFRGDALLLLFDGEGHALRAAVAASRMQRWIGEHGSAEASVGPVELRMSAGVWSGPCDLFLVEGTHRELVVAGPAASGVYRLEDEAQAGEVLVSPATAGSLDTALHVGERAGAVLLADAAADVPAAHVERPLPEADCEPGLPPGVLAHLAVAAGEAEHRRATVAFVRFGGTDDVIGTGGPDALLGRLQALAEAAAGACQAHGVTWLESDIDAGAGKLYLVAGAPASSGDDEEGMVRALRSIVAADVGLPLRAGVNRGPVFTGDVGTAARSAYTVMGDTVNLAARLVGRARDGTVLATDEVLSRTRTVYGTSREPVLVKGKERAVMAHEVGEPAGVRSLRPDAALVGRAAELEAIAAAVAAARMRQLRVVELVGEPGIGKSRLVQELPTLAAGLQQLVAAAEPYARSVPYAAWRGVLRQLAGITPEMSREEAGAILTPLVTMAMPDLAPWLPLLAAPFDAEVAPTAEADALDAAASFDRVHSTVAAFLDRLLMMPTALVVEDAHWLDDASESLLRDLVAAAAPRPWLVVVTSRPGREPVATGDHVVRLELEPLAAESLQELVRGAAGEVALSSDDVASVVARSGGNPLFAHELVAAVREGDRVEDLPDAVESLLTMRIDALDPADRMLLRYAAVLGPVVDLDVLAEALPADATLPETPWERLGEFVDRPSEGTVTFRHDLVRATAYEGLSFRRRRQIHGGVARALERRAGAQAAEHAAVLSLHYLEAGEPEPAWRHAVTAGHAARDGFANVVAAELYGRAVAAAEQLPQPPAGLREVLESLGDVTERFGAFDRSGAAYARARELARGDAHAEAEVLRKAGWLAEHLGNHADALAAYDEALALLDGLPDERAAGIRAHLEVSAAGVHHRRGDREEALELAARGAATAESCGDRESLSHASYLMCAVLTALGRYDEALRWGERSLALCAELGDDRSAGAVLINVGVAHYYEGRWDDALGCYHRAGEAKLRSGDVIGAAVAANNEAEILSDQGRFDEAEPIFEGMLQTCRASGYAIGIAVALGNLGRVAARAGRFEEAAARYEEARAAFAEQEAARWLEELRARVAELHVLEGRHAEARAEAQALLGELSPSASLLRAQAERTLGYALCQARLAGEAEPRFAESLRLAREAGAAYEEALTLRALGDSAADAILARLGVVRLPHVPLP